MPKFREAARKTRSGVNVRTALAVTNTPTPFGGEVASNERVASHLQGAKENYEVALVAGEIQRQKAQKVIEVMADTYTVTTDAVRYGHEVHRAQIDDLNTQTVDTAVVDQTTDALAEARDIYHNFLSDNLEAQGKLLTKIAGSDPTAQAAAPHEEVIALTPGERIKGVARRTRQ